METVLIIDNSASLQSDLASLLACRYRVLTATTAKRGIEVLRNGYVSAVLLDLKLPDSAGLELIKKIHNISVPDVPIIVIADHPDSALAVQAMRAGAIDFLLKNLNVDELSEKISKAIELRNLKVGIRVLQSSFADHLDDMIIVSEGMKRVDFEITRFAGLDYDVLLSGETGVGKDLVAYEIHRRSHRREKAFISVPLRSLSESLIESELFGHEKGAFSGAEKTKIGKLEAANGGTLYIPEVSSLTEEVQLKLLQFMQYKTVSRVGQDPRKPETKVDARIVMATNEDLEELMLKGKIRPDFYHRITGVKLDIPPLRSRIEAIEILSRYFLAMYTTATDGESYSFDPTVIAAFKLHRWLGNVRELKNVIRSAVAHTRGPVLKLNDFPTLLHSLEREDICSICLSSKFGKMSDFKSAVAAFKRAYVSEALKLSGNNIPKAAATIGMTRQGLIKAMHALGMEHQ